MLDTDTCSYIIREHPRHVLERLETVARHEVGISTVVAAELRYGAERIKSKKLAATIDAWLSLFAIEAWDDAAARAYAPVRAALEAKGRPIGNLDLLIAAHALSRRATLVTKNTRHFSQVAGLKIENWI